MPRIRTRWLVFIIFISIGLPLRVPADTVLRIGADEWCPFFCAENKDFDGYSVELLEKAISILGMKSKYHTASFPRVTAMVESGRWQIHGATDATFTPSMRIGKEAVASSKWIYVSRAKDSWEYLEEKSLDGKTLGVVNGYVYSKNMMNLIDKLKQRGKIVTVSAIAPQKILLELLKLDRVDVFIEDENVIKFWAKNMNHQDLIKLSGFDKSVDFYPGYHGTSPAAKKLADQLDDAIRKVKRDKEFMQYLRKKYNISR